MKKIFILLWFALILLSVGKVNAQEIMIPTISISPTVNPSPTTVNYPLPHPGIMPGENLYVIKTLRDKVVEIFTPDPLKKSNLYLLQADKRLSAALVFFNDGNEREGEIILSKSQNYLDKSLEKAISAHNNGENIMDVLAKIKASSAKQKEEVKMLISKSSGENKKKLENAYDKANNIEKRANQIKL